MIATLSVAPSALRARQKRWNDRLKMAVLVAMTVWLGIVVSHTVHHLSTPDPAVTSIAPSEGAEGVVLSVTAQGTMARIAGWSCNLGRDEADATDNTIVQSDGAAILSTVHNVQPMVVCPSV